jgi:phosphoribosylanthranilate isomerase
MTWVKICGITNLEDARTAVDAGADALGFVFYEKSVRKVDLLTVRDIVPELPKAVEKVGVFVDLPVDEVIDIVRRLKLTGVQWHAPQGLDLDSILRIKECCADSKVIYVRPGKQLLEEGFFISERARELLYALMFDSGSAQTPGGTGERFDWQNASSLMQAIGLNVPVIVAGGLNAQNVKEAMELLQPYGVDVSSGVEAHPGKKNPEKVRDFIRAVREADRVE